MKAESSAPLNNCNVSTKEINPNRKSWSFWKSVEAKGPSPAHVNFRIQDGQTWNRDAKRKRTLILSTWYIPGWRDKVDEIIPEMKKTKSNVTIIRGFSYNRTKAKLVKLVKKLTYSFVSIVG